MKKLASGALGAGLALFGATPAIAGECSPATTESNSTTIAAFVDAAKHDWQLGDKAADALRERADRYMSERYIQYHPGVESGREPFVQFHIKWYKDHPPQPPKNPDAAIDDTIIAHCDSVLYMHRIPRRHDGIAYQSYLFDMWKVKGNKADEHWDSFFLPWDQQAVGDEDPEGGDVEDAGGEPTAPAHPETCSANQIAQNRALIAKLRGATNGQAEAIAQKIIADDYVEHNPRLTAAKYQGREGYVRAATQMPQVSPGASLRYGMPEMTIANCKYVATVKKLRRYNYKADDGSTYDSYWFDTWEVKGGHLTQHWDATLLGADYHWDDVDKLNLRK